MDLDGAAADELQDREVAAVMRMARVLFGVVSRSAMQADDALTLPQLRALVLVATSPTPVTISAVAAVLDVHLSSASRLCDRLVTAGWIDRRDSLADRRHLVLSVTDAGWTVLAAVMTHRRQAFIPILQQLTPRDRAAVRRSFDKFADAAGEPPTSLDHPPFGDRGRSGVQGARDTDPRDTDPRGPSSTAAGRP
ncbi:MAG: MarR family winged helix-turn-helix transcriptional regulator [Propionibacteriaceae bacterium]